MIKKLHLKAKLYQLTDGLLTFSLDVTNSMLAKAKLKNAVNELVYLNLESYHEYKTNAQNRLFHALIGKYWESKQLNYSTFVGRVPTSWEELKTDVKVRFNPACKIQIANRHDVLNLGDLKGKFVEMPNKDLFFIKSWACFSVAEATKCIDFLIDEMMIAGIDVDSEVLEHKEIKTRHVQKDLNFTGV